jgi:hypothetical protein
MIKEWGNLSLTQEIVKQENEKNQQKGDSLINKFAEEIEKFKKIVIKLAKKKTNLAPWSSVKAEVKNWITKFLELLNRKRKK